MTNQRPNPNDPATKADLDEVLQTVNNAFEHVATKDQLDNAVEELRSEMVTKDELDTKLSKTVEEIKNHFDVVAENIHQDVSKANKDEVSALDTRVSRIENHLDLQS